MPESKSILHLYTLKFPQGGHEAFIGPELIYLAQSFDEVRIFPWTNTGEVLRVIPDNVQVVFTGKETNSNHSIIDKISLAGKNLFRAKFLKGLRYNLANAGSLLSRKSEMQNVLSPSEKILHYSYWFDEWATVLGLLSKAGSIASYVSRVHGFDLYDERHRLGYQPYRGVQINGLSKLLPISEMGLAYLKKRLPSAPLARAYLGTTDHGEGPMPAGAVLHLISVARAIPLKRLERIVETLSHCKSEIHWTHVGDGPSLSSIQEASAALPRHIKAKFLGNLNHDEVMNLYRSTPFNAFISLSETEGLPVSMMEAMSFGLPVISTDVGGVEELVNRNTGLLFDVNAETESIAELLDGLQQSHLSQQESRIAIRKIWKERFSDERNYPEFIATIKKYSV